MQGVVAKQGEDTVFVVVSGDGVMVGKRFLFSGFQLTPQTLTSIYEMHFNPPSYSKLRDWVPTGGTSTIRFHPEHVDQWVWWRSLWIVFWLSAFFWILVLSIGPLSNPSFFPSSQGNLRGLERSTATDRNAYPFLLVRYLFIHISPTIPLFLLCLLFRCGLATTIRHPSLREPQWTDLWRARVWCQAWQCLWTLTRPLSLMLLLSIGQDWPCWSSEVTWQFQIGILHLPFPFDFKRFSSPSENYISTAQEIYADAFMIDRLVWRKQLWNLIICSSSL